MILVVISIFTTTVLNERMINLPPKRRLGSLLFYTMIMATIPSVLSSFAYDYIKGIWFQDSMKNGVLRGNYPYFAEVNESYGNLRISLEKKGQMSIEGLEVSIRFPNSEYSKVMIWNYTEPVWFNIEPLEYEIVIVGHDEDYMDIFPIKVEENRINTIMFPIFD